MSGVEAAAAESRPRAFCPEGRSSGYMILRDCNLTASGDGTGTFVAKKLRRTYINPLLSSAILELTNCKFGVAANIDTGASYSLSNMQLTGCSGSFTFTFNRKSTELTDADKVLLNTIKANNGSTINFDFTDGRINNI